jgi:hypothetical protein
MPITAAKQEPYRLYVVCMVSNNVLRKNIFSDEGFLVLVDEEARTVDRNRVDLGEDVLESELKLCDQSC